MLAFVSERSGSAQIYTMNSDGSGLTQVTDDNRDYWYPDWSPDGRKIAFHSHRSSRVWSIYTVDADGSNLTQLTHEETMDAGPAWSPDGSQILFSRNEAIWVMNADGSDQRQVTSSDSKACCADWSPDGSQIVYESQADGNAETYVANADGTDPQRLTHDDGDDWWPDWSPDGAQIAFKSNRDGDFEIYVINVDGTGLRQLTNNRAEDGEPAWSPDGKKIAFQSTLDRGAEIYVMNADGSDPLRLTYSTGRDLCPAWKPESPATGFSADIASTVLNPDGTGTVADQDGNVYPIVHIGDQWWMAASLNATTDPEGNSILGYCHDNDEGNCQVYGRLYTWNVAMDGSREEGARGICPAGWHLPSDAEWTILFDFLGGVEVAGGKMKTTGTTHWREPNEAATDEVGFHGLPAGGYMPAHNLYEGLGIGVHFWSSTEQGLKAGMPTLHKDEAAVTRLVELKSVTASVRCVLD